MPDYPCRDCIHCHVQQRGTLKGPRDTVFALCAAQSEYPVRAEGRVHPDGVKISDADVRKVKSIYPDAIERGCTLAVRK